MSSGFSFELSWQEKKRRLKRRVFFTLCAGIVLAYTLSFALPSNLQFFGTAHVAEDAKGNKQDNKYSYKAFGPKPPDKTPTSSPSKSASAQNEDKVPEKATNPLPEYVTNTTKSQPAKTVETNQDKSRLSAASSKVKQASASEDQASQDVSSEVQEKTDIASVDAKAEKKELPHSIESLIQHDIEAQKKVSLAPRNQNVEPPAQQEKNAETQKTTEQNIATDHTLAVKPKKPDDTQSTEPQRKIVASANEDVIPDETVETAQTDHQQKKLDAIEIENEHPAPVSKTYDIPIQKKKYLKRFAKAKPDPHIGRPFVQEDTPFRKHIDKRRNAKKKARQRNRHARRSFDVDRYRDYGNFDDDYGYEYYPRPREYRRRRYFRHHDRFRYGRGYRRREYYNRDYYDRRRYGEGTYYDY